MNENKHIDPAKQDSQARQNLRERTIELAFVLAAAAVSHIQQQRVPSDRTGVRIWPKQIQDVASACRLPFSGLSMDDILSSLRAAVYLAGYVLHDVREEDGFVYVVPATYGSSERLQWLHAANSLNTNSAQQFAHRSVASLSQMLVQVKHARFPDVEDAVPEAEAATTAETEAEPEYETLFDRDVRSVLAALIQSDTVGLTSVALVNRARLIAAEMQNQRNVME